MINLAIIRNRQKQVIKKIAQAGLEGFLTTDSASVSYLTGFQGHDSWALIIGRRVWLLTDSRYTEQARKECFGCTIIQRKKSLADEVARVLTHYQTQPNLGLDSKISLSLQLNLRKQVKARFKPVSGLAESVRAIKEPGEIALIRKAVSANQSALQAMLQQLRIGMTENEAAGILELEIRKNKGHIGFETIVCFGPNGSRNHHIPGPRKLRKNDVILIDFGTAIHNYRCDMTRCFGVNGVTQEYIRAYETVAAAHHAAIHAMKPGVTLGEIDHIARKTIARSKFPVYGHGTGHGIGLDIHEQPFIAPAKSETLQPGQVITIEPGIYLPGKWGIRIEDDVLITPTGHKLLSTTILPSTLNILKVR